LELTAPIHALQDVWMACLNSTKLVSRLLLLTDMSKYLKNSGFFIRPEQIVLGSLTETRFSAKLGFRMKIVEPDTKRYVPLSELLAAVLHNSYYKTMINNFSHNCCVANPEIISHLFNTGNYKYPCAIALQFYIDALEVTKPLGSPYFSS
jgi:hypothetical protein